MVVGHVHRAVQPAAPAVWPPKRRFPQGSAASLQNLWKRSNGAFGRSLIRMKTIKCAELHLKIPSPSMREILDWALQRHKVDRMFVTLYTDRTRGKWMPCYSRAESATIEMFSPFILRVFLARSWPPRDYLRHPHIVCVMRYSSQGGEIMLKKQPDISGWTNPVGLLPEC